MFSVRLLVPDLVVEAGFQCGEAPFELLDSATSDVFSALKPGAALLVYREMIV